METLTPIAPRTPDNFIVTYADATTTNLCTVTAFQLKHDVNYNKNASNTPSPTITTHVIHHTIAADRPDLIIDALFYPDAMTIEPGITPDTRLPIATTTPDPTIDPAAHHHIDHANVTVPKIVFDN